MSSILALQVKEGPDLLDANTLEKQAMGAQKGAEGSIFVVYSGFVYDLGDPDGDIALTAQQLAKRFQKEGPGMTRGLWGRYSLVAVDMQRGRIYTFQDWLGGPYPLLVCGRENGITISDSLPWLLERYDGWTMDDEGAAGFLGEGRLYDSRTLVKGVYKQPPAHRGVIDVKSGDISFLKARYQFPKDPVGSVKDYVDAFDRSLKASIQDDHPLGCALSGGYDSNLSLSRLREFRKDPITAFTVGGTLGSDERPAARRIAGQYQDVRVVQGEVGPDTLQKFPRIVYQLEGALYERGVFLQYVLSQLAVREKVKYLLLSEGADQVLNPLVRITRWPKKLKPIRDFRPYDMISLVVLPKNGLMLRDTGVTPRYPYIRERYLRVTRSLYMKNKMFKQYHKAAVLKTLPEGIAAELQKIGGATQAMALFGDTCSFEKFKEKALSLRWHDPSVSILVSNKNPMEGKMDRCLKLIYLYLFEQVYIVPKDAQARRAAAEMPLNEYLDQIVVKQPVPELKTHTRNPQKMRILRMFKRFC